ncbi:MAG: hypothetical protein PHQ43_01240 [Dehalococcoidales bacterium]|nr:hypothetical protein [Dehalococcoidales bacterium]
MKGIPDPKMLVDSVADGAIEIAEGPVRLAKNTADVADKFASDVKANMEDFKNRMPDDPGAIPDCLIRGVGQAIDAGIGMVEGFGNAAMDTFGAVQNQIKRVTG